MKWMKKLSIAVVIGMLATVGCSESDPVSSSGEEEGTSPAAKLVISANLTGGHGSRPVPRTPRVNGGGEAIAAAFVTYVGHDGVERNVGSIGTTGNHFTFGFHADVRGNGTVQGTMLLVDHVSGTVIYSDVELLEAHPTHNHPVGVSGKPSFKMVSSTESVQVDGVPRPGWKFVNSPFFDSGEGGLESEDTVCFELFDSDGVKLLQWSAFLTSGNVQIVE